MTTTFPAMGTQVRVVVPGLPPVSAQAVGRAVAAAFEAGERCFSRFRATSELSRLNRAEGPTVVSRPLFDALVRARAYAELSGGLFDPTVGGAIEALGYDRSFVPGALDRAAPGPLPAAASFLDDVALDAATRAVTRAPHVRLDLGGLAKGLTVDRAALDLPVSGVVEAGGDAVLRGAGPEGEGWLVDVEDPADARRIVATLRVRDRAVATSAPNRRRWMAGSQGCHHLIDPRTGLPAASDLAQTTVLAPRAELADVLAKCAFLLGAREGARFLEEMPGVGAVLVRRDGQLVLVGEVELDA